jgi:D-aspartate ligase
MNTSSPAYILDLSPNGLAAVRALARRGVKVRSFDCDPSREGLRSRFGQPVLCPDPTLQPEGLLAFLDGLASTEPQPPFLLPCNDKFAAFVSDHRDHLARSFTFVLPRPELSKTFLEKSETYELAAGAGVPVPRTAVVAAGLVDAADLPPGFPFPAILKPSLTYALWGLTKNKVLVVRDTAEAARTLGRLPRDISYVLQEVIPGDETRLLYYSTYRDGRGRNLAEFVSRKVRQFPPGFGTSTLFESAHDEEVSRLGRSLFDNVGYTGLGSAEFKRDPRDGRLKLIEVNARLWLFHPLSVPTGVDFPLTAYLDATGQPVPPQTQSRETVKWVYLGRDLAVAFFQWRDGRLTLGEWLASYRGVKTSALWDAADPGPALYLPWAYLTRRLRRRGRRTWPGGNAEVAAGLSEGPPTIPELSWSEQMATLSPPPTLPPAGS